MAHSWYQKEDFSVMSQVGKVNKLLLYPVKSTRGIEVPHLQSTHSGFQYDGIGDRHWIVATSSGIGLSGRQQPRLCLIKPSIHGNMLHLDADGMATLKVPRDLPTEGRQTITLTLTLGKRVGLDCGDEAGQWLSKFIGKEGLRLVFAAEDIERLCLKDTPRFGPLTCKEDKIVYHDAHPGLLLSEASLQDLNTRLDKPIDMQRFRGNIIVSGSEGPYVEDEWKQLRIGESVLSGTVSCPRCLFTTIDTSTGIKDPDVEPLRTLKTYRIIDIPEHVKPAEDMPCFGLLLTTQKPGIIRVGDTIMATKEPAT